LYVPRKQGGRGLDAVRRSLWSRNYKTGGICGQKGITTDTDCQNARTHQSSNVTDSLHLKTAVERNKTNKEQQSRENKRKMASEDDAWTTAM